MKKEGNSLALAIGLITLVIALSLVVITTQTSSPTAAVIGIEELTVVENQSEQAAPELNTTIEETNPTNTTPEPAQPPQEEQSEPEETPQEPAREPSPSSPELGTNDELSVQASITSCVTVTEDSELTQDVTAGGTCLVVGAHNIVIDGGGFNLTGIGSGSGIDNGGAYQNVTIRNFGGISNFSDAIDQVGGYGLNITNNTLAGKSSGSYGIIYLQDTREVIINNNFITLTDISGNGERGIEADDNTTVVTISGNEFIAANNNQYGIMIEGDNNFTIINNSFNANASIIDVDNNATIRNNSIITDETAIALRDDGIVENNFITLAEQAVSSSDCDNCQVKGNTITNVEAGVLFPATDDALVYNNTFILSSQGSVFATSSGSSDNNNISHNTIINGTISFRQSNGNYIGFNTINNSGPTAVSIIFNSFSITIRDNNITTKSFAEDQGSIQMIQSSSATVRDNNITTEGYPVFTNDAFSYSNVISDNVANNRPIVYIEDSNGATVEHNDSIAFVLIASSDDVTLTNLTLTELGIFSADSNRLTIENSNISPTYGHGAFFDASLNVTIFNTSITMFDNNTNAVKITEMHDDEITDTSAGLTVNLSIITTYSNQSPAINVIEESDNATITNSIITTYGNSSPAIRIDSAHGTFITYNQIITYTNNSNAISSIDSIENEIHNNNITTFNTSSYGFYADSSRYNNLTQNRFNTMYSSAINIYRSSVTDSYFNQTIDITNTEQGEPIYYIFAQDNYTFEHTNNVGQLYIANSDNSIINNVTFDKDGIDAVLLTNLTIANTTINAGAEYAMHFIAVADSLIDRNSMTLNDLQLAAIYIDHHSSDDNRFTNNNISATSPYADGFYLEGGGPNNITGSRVFVSGTDKGAVVHAGGYTYAHNNNFTSADGPPVFGSSSSSRFNATYDCTTTNIIGGPCIGGNWWGGRYNYTGADDGSGVGIYANGTDGIGDTDIPYTSNNNISSNTPDYLPLTVTDEDTNIAPAISTVLLNTTNTSTNNTFENLTVYTTVTDADGDGVKNITTWSVDGENITLLAMPFDGGTLGADSTIKDYSENAINATFGDTGTAVYNATQGVDSRGAYYFNGSVHLNLSENNAFNTTDFTIMFWAKGDNSPAGDAYNETEMLLGRDLSIDVDGFLPLQFYWNSLTHASDERWFISGTGVTYPGEFSADTWYHLAATFNGSLIQIYQDGVLKNSSNASLLYSTNHTLYLGNDGSDTFGFAGYLDELFIFNRSLSEQTIYQAYVHQRPEVIASNDTNIGELWQACITPNDNQIDGTRVCSNELNITSIEVNDGNIAPVVDSINITTTNPATNDSNQNITSVFNISDANGDNTTNISRWVVDNSPFYILNMPFENHSNTTGLVIDYSGNALNGTIAGGVSFNPKGGHDGFGAYNFHGNASRITWSGLNTQFDTEATLMMWIKLNNSVPPSSTTSGFGKFGTTTIVVDHYPHTSGDAYFSVFRDDRLGPIPLSGSVNREEWHLLTITQKPGTDGWKLYQNDILVHEEDGESQVFTPSDMHLGYDASESRYLLGNVSHLWIVNRSLSYEQINATYRNMSIIVSQEINGEEEWDLCVTPNDGTLDGTEVCSSFLQIQNASDVSCGYINDDIIFTENIRADGSCFIVNASDIIIDGAGYKLIGNGSGIAINNTNHTNLTVKNFDMVENFTYSVYIDQEPRRETNNTIFNNSFVGSILSDNTAIIGYADGGNALRDNISSNAFTSLSGSSSPIVTDPRRATIKDNFFYLNESADEVISLATDGHPFTFENNTIITYSNGEGNLFHFSAGSQNHIIRNNTFQIGLNNSNLINTVIASHFLITDNNITITGENTTWLRITTAGSNYTFLNNEVHTQNFNINDTASSDKLLIYNNSFAEIVWNLTSLTTNMDLVVNQTIYLENNTIGLSDEEGMLELNGSATIKFYGLSYSTTPWLMRNGARCDDTDACNISYSSGTLIANVSSFSNYTTQDEAASSGCGYLNDDFTLTQNIQANETCFTINASNIVLDGAGFNLSGNVTSDHAINESGKFTNVTIKNFGLISNYENGVYLLSLENSTITNNTFINVTQNVILLNTNTVNNNVTANNITFNSSGTAIFTRGAGHGVFNNTVNVIDSISTGIYVQSDNSTVIGNNVTGGIQTVQVTSDNNAILRNRISGASLANLYFSSGASQTLVQDNIISSSASAYGVLLLSATETISLINNNLSSSAGNIIAELSASSATNTLFYNNTFGEINWTKTNISTGADISLTNTIIIEDNNIGLEDIANLGEINASATITFYGLSYNATPFLLKNSERCDNTDNCNISYNTTTGTLVANVTSFSNYTTQEDDANICGFINEDYTLTQNLQIEGDCFTINASHITLDGAGFTLTGNGSGIAINNTRNKTNVTIKGFGSINNFTWGMFFREFNSSLIQNNTLSSGLSSGGQRSVIRIAGASSIYNNITHNHITSLTNETNGITLGSSAGNNSVMYNTILTNATGANAISITGPSFTHVKNNTVFVYGINSSGVDIGSNTENFIENNTIHLDGDNVIGVTLSKSNNNIVWDNNINSITGSNTRAFEFIDSSTGNLLRNNNISSGDLSTINSNTVSNLLTYNNSFGQINWTKTNLTNNISFELGTTIFIENNLIGLTDIGQTQELNGSATITFYGLSYLQTPYLLRNGERCDDTDNCNISYSSGTLIANITSFSNYTTQEVDNSVYCGYINENTTLTNDIQFNDSSCFIINASNIVLDGAGFNLTGNGSLNSIAINYTLPYDNVTIRNFDGINYATNAIVIGNESSAATDDFSDNIIIRDIIMDLYLENGSNNFITYYRVNNLTVLNNTVQQFNETNNLEINGIFAAPPSSTHISNQITIEDNVFAVSNSILNISYAQNLTISQNLFRSGYIQRVNESGGFVQVALEQVTATNLTENNIVLSGDGLASLNEQAIKFVGVSNSSIKHNRITGFYDAALDLEANYTVVENNTINSGGSIFYNIRSKYNNYTNNSVVLRDDPATLDTGFIEVYTTQNQTTIVSNNLFVGQGNSSGITNSFGSGGLIVVNNNITNNTISLYDTTSTDDYVEYSNEFASIVWNKSSVLSQMNLSVGETIFLEDNLVGLDTVAATQNLNGTATITFYGLSHSSTPQLLKNGERCDENESLCNITTYSSGILTAVVSSFSNYTTYLATTTTPPSSGGGGGGGRAPSGSAPNGQSCPEGSVNIDNECHEIWCDNGLDDDADDLIDCNDSDCSEKEICNQKENPAEREEAPIQLSQEGKKFRLWWIWVLLAGIIGYLIYYAYTHYQRRPHPIPTFLHKPKGFIFPVWNKHFKHLSWHDKFQAVNKAIKEIAKSVPASYSAITKVKSPKKVKTARKSIKPTIIPIPKGAVKLQNELARVEKQLKHLHVKAVGGRIVENVWSSHGQTKRSWTQRKALQGELKGVSAKLHFGPEDVKAQQVAAKEVASIARKIDAMPQSKQMTKLQKELAKVEGQLQDIEAVMPHGAVLTSLPRTHGHQRMSNTQKKKLHDEFLLAVKELGLQEKPKQKVSKRVVRKTKKSKVPFFAGTHGEEK